VRPFLKGMAGSLVGGVLLLLAWTAYLDHARVNAMWNYLNARGAAVQPSPAPETK
jgi:hypothetical protein